MASQTAQSQLLAQLGGEAENVRKALAANKDREPEPDQGSRLPAGILNGVFQLKECRITKVKEGGKNAGKLQFYASGVVIEPVHVTNAKTGVTVRTAGMQTRVFEALYPTPEKTGKNARKTPTDHFVHVQEILKRLGARGDSVTLDNIEATMRRLASERPFVAFRTWRGSKVVSVSNNGKVEVWEQDPDTGKRKGDRPVGVYRNATEALSAHPGLQYQDRDPMVNESWGLKIEDYVAPGAEEAAAAGIQESDNGEPEATTQEEPPAAGGDSSGASAEGSELTDDLDELVRLANEDEQLAADAQQKLTDLAMAAGATKEDVENEELQWEDIKDMIESLRAEKEAAAPAPAAEEKVPAWAPEADKTCRYKPEGGKKVKCLVTSVDKRKKTACLKSLINPRQQWKDKPWAELEAIA